MSQQGQAYYTSASSRSRSQPRGQGQGQDESQGRGSYLPPIREYLSEHFPPEQSPNQFYPRPHGQGVQSDTSYLQPPESHSQDSSASRGGRGSSKRQDHPPGVDVLVNLGEQGLVQRGQPRTAGVNPTTRKYQCETCGGFFDKPASLQIHKRTHTGEQPFVCRFPGCGKAFGVKSNASRHERRHTADSAFESADRGDTSRRRGSSSGSSNSSGTYYTSQ